MRCWCVFIESGQRKRGGEKSIVSVRGDGELSASNSVLERGGRKKKKVRNERRTRNRGTEKSGETER